MEAITNPILRAKIITERRKSCTLISTLRNFARIVLENPPGVNFHRKRPETWDANLPPAGDSLFAFWHQCGANGPQIRKRRNALPGRVWDAINGRNAKARKIQNGAGGSSRISVALARERIASQSKDAKRGLKHPLADCPRTIALRKLAGDGKTMKELLEFAADRSQGGGATLCAIHNKPIAETYLQEILRAEEARKVKRIGRALEGPRAVKFFHAKITEDLTASLEAFRERSPHLFGLWCESEALKLKPSTPAGKTPVPTIAKEIFGMSFPERLGLFGEYARRLQGLSYGDLSRRVHMALSQMLEERQLEVLIESKGATPRTAEETLPPAAESKAKVKEATGEKRSKPKRVKRSAQPDEARLKLIGALTAHHHYANGVCENWQPAGNNQIARDAEVQPGTASKFFKSEFGGYVKYRYACGQPATLIASLKLLNGEFSPILLMGSVSPRERSPRDEG